MAAALAFALLLAERTRSWWTWKAPTALALGAVLTAILGVVVDRWWQPFPEGLPTEVLLWMGVAILGVTVSAMRLPSLSWGRRAGALACAAVVGLTGLNQVNRYFQSYMTTRAVLGPWLDTGTDFHKAAGHPTDVVAAPPGRMLADVWTPPAKLPASGTLSEVTIPGTASHFNARKAWVYLPPAYQAAPRPQLPLLVLLPGQPGSPRDWIDAGGVQKILDTYAAAHHGLAPVTVMPDATGSTIGNTLCMDSRLGNAETYLTTDLPAWVTANLQVAPPDKGAVGSRSPTRRPPCASRYGTCRTNGSSARACRRWASPSAAWTSWTIRTCAACSPWTPRAGCTASRAGCRATATANRSAGHWTSCGAAQTASAG